MVFRLDAGGPAARLGEAGVWMMLSASNTRK
jgi:hypothetical protein